ncbi:MAG: hypothetical protein ABWY36_06710 [Leifsonia sp.]
MTDRDALLHVLHRLRREVEVASDRATFTPERWHSPAQRACAERMAELHHDLRGLAMDLDRALDLAAASTVPG